MSDEPEVVDLPVVPLNDAARANEAQAQESAAVEPDPMPEAGDSQSPANIAEGSELPTQEDVQNKEELPTTPSGQKIQEPKQESPVLPVLPALIYDGSPFPDLAIKERFPGARVHAHQGRNGLGQLYYNINTGRNALVPDPLEPLKGYFQGEEVR